MTIRRLATRIFSSSWRALPATSALLATLATADAASYTWNPTVTSGSNNWNLGTNWAGGSAPVSASDTTLEFTGIATSGVLQFFNNISSPFQLNGIVLAATGTNQPGVTGGILEFVNNGTTGPSILQNGTTQFNFSNSMSIGSGVSLTLGGNSTGQAQLNGVISGAGALVINASGTATTWVLNNANTFAGGVTLTGGRLAVLNNSALGAGTLTINGGMLRSSTSTNRILGNLVDIGGNFVLGQSSPTSVTFSNTTTLLGSGETRTITLSGATASTISGTFSGPIVDGGNANGLTLAGTGILEFAGSAANTYTGLTTVNGANATLVLNKTGADAIAGNLTATSGTVRLGQSNQIADTSTLTVNSTFDLNGNSETVGSFTGGGLVTSGAAGNSVLTVGGTANTQFFYTGTIQNGTGTVSLVKQGADTLVLSGSSSYSGGTTLNNGQLVADNNSALGSGTVTLSGGVLRTRDADTLSRTIANNIEIGGNVQFGITTTQSTLTLDGATTLLGSGTNRVMSAFANTSTGNMNPVIFNGAIGDGGNANGVTIQGSAANVKVVFAGINTYTGETIVNAGTLIVNGSIHASSAVTVKSGAIVGGSGAINGSLTVESGGIAAPGESPGTLEVGGAFDLDAGGTLAMELTGATVGTEYDQLIVGGAITLDGDLDITLTYAPTEGTNFFLIDNLGGGAVTGAFAGLAQGATFVADGQLFQISYTGDSGTNSFTGGNDVVVQAVPEPSAIGMLGAGLFMLTHLLRRKKI